MNWPTRAAAALVAALLVVTGLHAIAGAQPSGRSIVRLETDGDTSTSDDVLAVSIVADNVENLGGFQLTLAFDPEIIEYQSLARTEFLGSTGREVQCSDPRLLNVTDEDPDVPVDAVELACVTLREQPAGPDGTGTLAIAEFRPLKEGDTRLTVTDAVLISPEGNPSAVSVEPADIEISNDRSIVMYAAIAVGVVLVVAVAAGGLVLVSRRRRGGAFAG
jgi:hypothetical protein